MSPKQLVKISNTLGIVSILLLVYWVFSFILIEVFGLKVFKENITESFYLSVIGILALMVGALIINIMFNLTRIAERSDLHGIQVDSNKKIIIILLIIFPLIASLLFLGDFITKKKKEKLMISSAKTIIIDNDVKSLQLLQYDFNETYINKSAEILKLFSKADTYFPYVSVITRDTINGSAVYLSFDSYSYENTTDTFPSMKINYIRKTTKEEREYLKSIFMSSSNALRYSVCDGKYELFYPYRKDSKVVVMYFSDYQRYGKN